MAANISNLTHLSEPVIYNLFILTALSAVTLLVGVGAIAIRLRVPDRRFLVQKTQRREGTYWVPHTPIFASLWIIAYSLIAMANTLVSINNWTVGSRRALRIVAFCLPFPVLCCVLMVSSGPVYAAHLFPLEVVAAKWPRLGPALRFKPWVVNAVCHLSPVVFAVPAIGLSVAWSGISALAEEQSAILQAMAADPEQTEQALQAQGAKVAALYAQGYGIYRAQWAIWSVAFALPCLLYCAYQLVLLPVLLQEIDVLDTVRTSMLRLDHGTHLDQVPELKFVTGENDAAASSRPSLHSRPSTERKHFPTLNVIALGASLRRTPSIRDEVQSFTRLELLRANTRLSIFEAAVSSAFCISWSVLSATKAAIAPRILPYPDLQAKIYIVGIYLGMTFCLLSAILLLARGHNANRVVESTEFASFRTPSAGPSQRSHGRSLSQTSLSSSIGHGRRRSTLIVPTLADVPASPRNGIYEGEGEPLTRQSQPVV